MHRWLVHCPWKWDGCPQWDTGAQIPEVLGNLHPPAKETELPKMLGRLLWTLDVPKLNPKSSSSAKGWWNAGSWQQHRWQVTHGNLVTFLSTELPAGLLNPVWPPPAREHPPEPPKDLGTSMGWGPFPGDTMDAAALLWRLILIVWQCFVPGHPCQKAFNTLIY